MSFHIKERCAGLVAYSDAATVSWYISCSMLMLQQLDTILSFHLCDSLFLHSKQVYAGFCPTLHIPK